MKKRKLSKGILFFMLALFSFKYTSAQEKFDSVYMKNGDVNVGKITAINDDAVSFTYKGETLGYNFKGTDINKIVFASGRVQNFGASDPGPSVATNITVNDANVDHHNKAAVLPFGYINPNQQTNTEMGYKVQDECYNYLSGKAAAFTIQDPSATNALLGKAGVSFDNIRSFTNQEICNILGVEYIVRGTITANITSSTSTGSTTYNQKNQDGTDKKGNSTDKTTGSVYSSSSSQQNYHTTVLMEVYQDDGKKVFGQDRTSFWQTVDAYKATIQYLLKKTPIYGR